MRRRTVSGGSDARSTAAGETGPSSGGRDRGQVPSARPPRDNIQLIRRVVGDEHLAAIARIALPEVNGPNALVRLPTRCQLCESGHRAVAVLPISGRRSEREVKALERLERRRSHRGNKDPGESDAAWKSPVERAHVHARRVASLQTLRTEGTRRRRRGHSRRAPSTRMTPRTVD